MKSDPFILVNCDGGCGESEEVELTPLAGGAYDERNVDRQLERLGWVIKDNGETFCPECKDKEK